MNIGMVTEELPYLPSAGGFRLYGANLIRGLSRRHRVDLISLVRDGDDRTRDVLVAAARPHRDAVLDDHEPTADGIRAGAVDERRRADRDGHAIASANFGRTSVATRSIVSWSNGAMK